MGVLLYLPTVKTQMSLYIHSFSTKLSLCIPFPPVDVFRRICSRRLFKTLWQKEKFPLLPQCFQLYLMIKLSFMEIFRSFANMFSMSSAAELSYVGKGYLTRRGNHLSTNITRTITEDDKYPLNLHHNLISKRAITL